MHMLTMKGSGAPCCPATEAFACFVREVLGGVSCRSSLGWSSSRPFKNASVPRSSTNQQEDQLKIWPRRTSPGHSDPRQKGCVDNAGHVTARN